MAKTLIEFIASKITANAQPASKAAAAGGFYQSSNNGGAGMIGQYYSYIEGDARNKAMSVPTVSRARDLMASVIGCMDLKMYNEIWNGDEMEKMPFSSSKSMESLREIQPSKWMKQSAPRKTTWNHVQTLTL